MPPSPPQWPISFGYALLRATLYVLFIAGIAQGGYFEALYFPNVRYSELGFTEFTQTLVLASCCILLIYIRQVLRVWPTVTLLLLAFIAASLVREQDFFLDHYVAKHTWKILVTLIVVPALVWVIVQRRRFLEEFNTIAIHLPLGCSPRALLLPTFFHACMVVKISGVRYYKRITYVISKILPRNPLSYSVTA